MARHPFPLRYLIWMFTVSMCHVGGYETNNIQHSSNVEWNPYLIAASLFSDPIPVIRAAVNRQVSVDVDSIGPELAAYQKEFKPPKIWDNCNDVTAKNDAPEWVTVTWPNGKVVLCNGLVDGGGWTVVQRRTKGNFDFRQSFIKYKTGFGFPFVTDHWLGLNHIYDLTYRMPFPKNSPYDNYELLFMVVTSKDGVTHPKTAKLEDFHILNEYEGYKSLYRGTSSDWFPQWAFLNKNFSGFWGDVNTRKTDLNAPWGDGMRWDGEPAVSSTIMMRKTGVKNSR